MDSQIHKLLLQFLRQLQHLPLRQPVVFLLQDILFLLKLPPDSRNLQQFSPGSMQDLLCVEQYRFFQIQVTQYRSPVIKLLLILLPNILLLCQHKLPPKLPGLQVLKRTLPAPASLLRLFLLSLKPLPCPRELLKLLLISLSADLQHSRLIYSKNITDQGFLIATVEVVLCPVIGRCRVL